MRPLGRGLGRGAEGDGGSGAQNSALLCLGLSPGAGFWEGGAHGPRGGEFRGQAGGQEVAKSGEALGGPLPVPFRPAAECFQKWEGE